MASSAFKNKELATYLSQRYVSVLVDGDVEKKVCQKYGVRGYPTVKFMDPKGEVRAEMRDRSPGSIRAVAEGAAKKLKLRPAKAYVKVAKASARLRKAMAKKKYADALKQIGVIEKVSYRGLDHQRAMQIKRDLEKVAADRLAEAKALLKDSPAKARSKLKGIAREFAGLPAAEEAAALAKKAGTG